MKQTGAIKLLSLTSFSLSPKLDLSFPLVEGGGSSCRTIPKKEPLHKQMPGIRLQPGECVNSFSSAINTHRASV